MIEVIHYQNEKIEKPFESIIAKSYDEVRKLLPDLPKTIKIYFSNYGFIPEIGTGGFAYSKDIITISIEPEFADKDIQLKSIRPTIFHEAFHIYQRFTAESGPFSAIDNAIYEGMATVFEREYTGVIEPFGNYEKTPIPKLEDWVKELRKIDADKFEDEDIYTKWKFYNPELKERWIVYRTGTWMIDQILNKHGLKILDMKDKTAAEIIALHDE